MDVRKSILEATSVLAMTEVLVVLILWSFRMRALTLYVGSLATSQVVSMSTWVLVPLLPSMAKTGPAQGRTFVF